jgi:hypothetical protein
MKKTTKKHSILLTVFSTTAGFALSIASLGMVASPFACVAEDQAATNQSSEKPAITQPVAKVIADETGPVEGCKLSYTSLMGPYRERGADGVMALPEQRVVFGGKMSEEYILTFRTQGKRVECPLICQDVAYFLDDKGERGKRVAVVSYAGCPMNLGDDLEAQKDIELREEVRIPITSSKDTVLWSDLNAAVPFLSNGQQVFFGATCANVTWVFVTNGMTFHTAKNDYVTEKAGAMIQFTKDGIKFDGVKKQSRSGATSLAPTKATAISTNESGKEIEIIIKREPYNTFQEKYGSDNEKKVDEKIKPILLAPLIDAGLTPVQEQTAKQKMIITYKADDWLHIGGECGFDWDLTYEMQDSQGKTIFKKHYSDKLVGNTQKVVEQAGNTVNTFAGFGITDEQIHQNIITNLKRNPLSSDGQ